LARKKRPPGASEIQENIFGGLDSAQKLAGGAYSLIGGFRRGGACNVYVIDSLAGGEEASFPSPCPRTPPALSAFWASNFSPSGFTPDRK